MQGRVLIVAGSDSGGGAGIQADIKTVTALNGFAMTAITALTAQNTEGVFDVHPVPAPFIQKQMRLVIDDIGVDAIKIGMLHSIEVIEAVASVVEKDLKSLPLLIDPVMVAKGGAPLLQSDAVDVLRERLLPLATIITPNLPEASLLVGFDVRTRDDMRRAGNKLCRNGINAVLMKGGHAEADLVEDILLTTQGYFTFASPRLKSRNTHGTGCTLGSAIATGLAQGFSLHDAVERARLYVLEAIRTAPNLGRGHGPLNHAHTVRD